MPSDIADVVLVLVSERPVVDHVKSSELGQDISGLDVGQDGSIGEPGEEQSAADDRAIVQTFRQPHLQGSLSPVDQVDGAQDLASGYPFLAGVQVLEVDENRELKKSPGLIPM